MLLEKLVRFSVQLRSALHSVLYYRGQKTAYLDHNSEVIHLSFVGESREICFASSHGLLYGKKSDLPALRRLSGRIIVEARVLQGICGAQAQYAQGVQLSQPRWRRGWRRQGWFMDREDQGRARPLLE
jgi:hypothetical protein